MIILAENNGVQSYKIMEYKVIVEDKDWIGKDLNNYFPN